MLSLDDFTEGSATYDRVYLVKVVDRVRFLDAHHVLNADVHVLGAAERGAHISPRRYHLLIVVVSFVCLFNVRLHHVCARKAASHFIFISFLI